MFQNYFHYMMHAILDIQIIPLLLTECERVEQNNRPARAIGKPDHDIGLIGGCLGAFDGRTRSISDKRKAAIKNALKGIGVKQFGNIIKLLLTIGEAGSKMLLKPLADLR